MAYYQQTSLAGQNRVMGQIAESLAMSGIPHKTQTGSDGMVELYISKYEIINLFFDYDGNLDMIVQADEESVPHRIDNFSPQSAIKQIVQMYYEE